MNRPGLRVALILCSLWCAAWLFLTRHAMLDDALIHLRYASNLARLHSVTYDGVHPSFGTSSPLYLVLLAAVYSAVPSVFVPKAVSVCGYLVLLWLTLRLYRRSNASRVARGAALLNGLVLLSPMALRWLTDGMETSIVCAAAILLAFTIERIPSFPLRGSSTAAALFALGFLLSMLRIELTALSGIAAVTLGCSLLHRRRASVAAAVGTSAALFAGSLAALGTLRLIFGSILPDTAMAKAGGHPSLNPLHSYLHVSVSAVVLGAGSAGVYLLTAALVASRREKHLGLLAFLCANSPLPVLLALACLRGQAIQGIRYFLWASLFSVAWNVLALSRQPDSVARWRLERNVLLGTAAVLLVLLPLDGRYAWLSMHGRAHTFDQMSRENLSQLAGQTIIADDIGFIGYFTQANVCDTNGLVNGRAAAQLSEFQRILACVRQQPKAVFISEVRKGGFPKYIPGFETQWVLCDVVDFTNVQNNDRHYLFVRKEDADRFCPVPRRIFAPAAAAF